jgi:hypothetical protein
MLGHTHVSTNGTNAIISHYYTGDTFVEYNLGPVNNIPAQFSVKYFGLWDHSNLNQKNWATWQQKLPSETPTNDEKNAANGPSGAKRNAGRQAVQNKANAWAQRIENQYNQALRNWAVDAGIPTSVVIAVEFEHPKFSAKAPNTDSTTHEWSDYPWLTVSVDAGRTTCHPDRRWVLGLGVETGSRAYVMAGDSVASTKNSIAHEAGHQSKDQFKRKNFGSGDHSPNPGLMDPWGSRNVFRTSEKNILRGKN